MSAFLTGAYAHTVAAFASAFALDTLIGFERQWRQRNAGLRTNVLVSVGAAAFSDLGLRLLGADGATRIVAYVVSGIGFLGAGVILKDGTSIRGLNTAATLTVFILAGNTLLRPMVNWINRRPIVAEATEAQYRVHVICRPEAVSGVRDLLDAELERAHYPIRDVETLSDNEEQVELAAMLVPTTAAEAELDGVVAALQRSPLVRSATWSVATTT